MSEFTDGRGLTLDDARHLLGEDRSRWPTAKRVRDPVVCEVMHHRFWTCWACDESGVQAHHMFSGSRGKTDEYCAIAMLCPECHAAVNTKQLPLSNVLYLKWLHDKANTDWQRMCLLAGRFLELEGP